MGRRGYGDTFPDTPPNPRDMGGFGTAGCQLDSVSRLSDADVSDAQRALTRLALRQARAVAESREVWQALGVDRRVA